MIWHPDWMLIGVLLEGDIRFYCISSISLTLCSEKCTMCVCFFFHKLPWCFGSNLTSQMKLKKGVKVSVREFKYIKSGTKTDHPCSHCIPAGACLSSPLIWQKDPNQALSLGLIVCDIHNTPLVNCYLHLDGEQVVLLKLWVLESLLSSQKNK